MIPLRGFVEGDTMGLLVFTHQDMLLSEVARRLLTSASVRVDPGASAEWELRWNDAPLSITDTVSGAGLTALDRIDLRRITHPGQRRRAMVT